MKDFSINSYKNIIYSKSVLLFLYFFIYTFSTLAQIDTATVRLLTNELTDVRNQSQTLKLELDKIKSEKENLTSVQRTRVEQISRKLKEERTKSLRITGGLIRQFGMANQSINTILSSLNLGIQWGQATSPIAISPTIAKKSQVWLSTGLDIAPAIGLLAGMLLKPDNSSSVESEGIGLAIGTIASFGLKIALTPSQKSITNAVDSNFNQIADKYSALNDVVSFNHAVIGDLKQFESAANSVVDYDAVLQSEFIILDKVWSRLEALTETQLQNEIENKTILHEVTSNTITTYREYVTTSENLLSRFQQRLTRTQYVLAQGDAALKGYKTNPIMLPMPAALNDEARTIREEVQDSINKLDDARKKHSTAWNTLNSQYLDLTPDKLRELQLFLSLTESLTSLSQ